MVKINSFRIDAFSNATFLSFVSVLGLQIRFSMRTDKGFSDITFTTFPNFSRALFLIYFLLMSFVPT